MCCQDYVALSHVFVLDRANLKLHQAEAGDFLMKLATDVTKGIHPPLDLLLVDVFNGKDNVPQQLCSAGMQHCFALHTVQA